MFLGLYLAKKLSQRRLAQMKGISGMIPIALFTAFCIIVRTSIMLPVDYAIYSSILPIVIGVNIPYAYIIGLIPFTILFNVLVPLINETAGKTRLQHPRFNQTGPAARKDFQVIEKHLEMLKDEPAYREIYRLLTENIIQHHSK